MKTALRPASERQINFVRSLIARRDVSTVADLVRIVETYLDEDKLTHGMVSSAIDVLKTLPLKPAPVKRDQDATTVIEVTTVTIPAGHYAIGPVNETKFYRVDRPAKGHWSSRIFLSVQASDEFYPVKNLQERAKVFKAISIDPRAAAIRYGKELGRCAMCRRALTDPGSIAAGIGPICAGKHGW